MSVLFCYNNHMRQSIINKQATKQRKKLASHEQHQRTALWLTAVLAGCLSLLIINHTNWRTTTEIKANNAQIATDQQQAKQYRALAKVNAAKRTEQAAILSVEQQIQTEGISERKLVSISGIGLQNEASCGIQNPDSSLAIISKQHCFTPLDWQPNDLESNTSFTLRRQAATQVNAMTAAAENQGVTFTFTSSYRSFTDQQVVYQEWLSLTGDAYSADVISARPGYSEHQTGLAMDLKTTNCALECFATTAAYQWLMANAANYGFIERYPKGLSPITGYAPEPWHWRFIGVEAAKDMQAKGIKTLEQYLAATAAD